MSKFVLNEAADNGFQDGYIDDVTFLYVCIQDAKTKFKSDEKEYSVKCVVDEDTYDAFAEAFPKNVSTKGAIKTAEFESTYGIDAPFPDAKKQYTINVKMQHADQNGVPHPDGSFKRPKVLVPVEDGVKDITKEMLIGNGSKGNVDFWVSSSDYGSFPKLTNICVTDLIEYERKEGTGGGKGSTRYGKIVNQEDSSDRSTEAKEELAQIDATDEF